MPLRLLVLLSGSLSGSEREGFTNTNGFNLSREVCGETQRISEVFACGLLRGALCIPWLLCLLLLFNVASAVGALCTPMSEGGLGGRVTLLLL